MNRTVRRHGTPGTFRQHCSQSCVYSDETTWCPRWKIPLRNPWKHHFQDSNFQNVLRCLSPQKTCASGVSSKAAYYSLSASYLKTFREPWSKTAQSQFLGDVFATITIVVSSLAEPDMCKTYAHATDLLCWTMFQLCYVHYCLCNNYATYHIK